MNLNEQHQFIVDVCCMTFNHVQYITDAMNGFCMQETNFPFICTIIDDASTDGEQEVIKQYLEQHFDLDDESTVRNEVTNEYVLTYARHKKNLNCFFAVLYLKNNHYSIKKSKMPYIEEWLNNAKYIAYCEGDDFWTYSQKLQKQYDVLEAHPEYTMSINSVQVVEKDGITHAWGTIPVKESFKKDGTLSLEDFCREEYYNGHWCFHLSSFFIRKEIYDVSNEWRGKQWRNFPYGDMPLLLTCLLNGDAYFFTKIMGCYRWLSGGYNSSVNSNPQKWIYDNKKLRKALIDFDKYTNKKYHLYIKKRISIIDIGLINRGDKSPLVLLFPRYWTIPFGRKEVPRLIVNYLCGRTSKTE